MKKFIYISPFILGALCFIISAISSSEITPDGFLVEPFFFLIPTGYIFFLIGILVSLIRVSYVLHKKIKKA